MYADSHRDILSDKSAREKAVRKLAHDAADDSRREWRFEMPTNDRADSDIC